MQLLGHGEFDPRPRPVATMEKGERLEGLLPDASQAHKIVLTHVHLSVYGDGVVR
jgi:hypothetical protein